MILSKVCSRCQEPKSLDQFGNRSSAADGLSYWCKPCTNSHMAKRHKEGKSQEWKKRNPEKAKEVQRRAIFKMKYGITLEEYEALLKKQNGICAICKEPCRSGRRLCVDHNHETGQVRGLLCVYCNRNIVGIIDTSKELVMRALKYVDGEVDAGPVECVQEDKDAPFEQALWVKNVSDLED